MAGKICLITGATSGIGKATALGLAQKGAHLVLVGRHAGKSDAVRQEIIQKSGNTEIQSMVADLSSLREVERLGQQLQNQLPRLDVLINNAGLILGKRKLTAEGHEYTFALNHLAYFSLTGLLLNMLKKRAPARIINVSSKIQGYAHIDFDDLMAEKSYRPFKAYGQSKLANILFTYELSKRLAGTGVTVNCLHPGTVRSNFGQDMGDFFRFLIRIAGPFMRSNESGAHTCIYLAASPEVAQTSGKYYVKCKPTHSSPESYDPDVAAKLWKISEKLTGIVYGN